MPPLNLLSDKLKLSPSIAGITLLAIGNGKLILLGGACLKPNTYYSAFVACNTVYTTVSGGCNMMHEIGNISISCMGYSPCQIYRL